MRDRPQLLLILLGVLGAVLAALSLVMGAVGVSWGELFPILGRGLGLGEGSTDVAEIVVWDLRMPRLVLAILAGAALAVSGALLQGLFRNPLADPGLLGISSGGAVGAVVFILFGAQVFGASALWETTGMMISAAIGSAVAAAAVFVMAFSGNRVSVVLLLLAGIAVNAFAGALLGIASFISTEDQLRSFVFWSLGSLATGTWEKLAILGVIVGLLLVTSFRLARPLNAYALGERQAHLLGFSTARINVVIVVLVAVLVGAITALCGIIGFIGLAVPHLVRLMIGPDHRWLIPGSALAGACLLAGADLLGRTLIAPTEIPVGTITALVGAPLFVSLIFSQRRHLATQ